MNTSFVGIAEKAILTMTFKICSLNVFFYNKVNLQKPTSTDNPKVVKYLKD